ncbi:MAG TPA: protein kinase [Vicinamibacterales bacterium]|nr:protein kinase [Vicinamibacterales bacterium]
MTFEAGAVIGHFRIVKPLGAGGMGIVYLAEDLQLARHVALKVLTATADPSSSRRVLREARAAGALDHPNIAAIHEVADHDGVPVIVMAYCAGETLQARLARGTLPIREIASAAAQAAAGLAAAHAGGIVHRDLKPANMMVGPDGHLRILDFGLATIDDPRGLDETASRLTAVGTTAGTVAYMSPEQARGEPIDQRTDIWALGVSLYELLTGRRPFDGGNPFATMQAVLTDTPVPVHTLRPDTPSVLAEIVDLALEKDRARRSLTAREIHGRIVDWQAAQSDGARVRALPIPRRWRAAIGGAIAVLMIAAAGVGWWWQQRRDRVRWARDVALPRIQALANADQFTAALDLSREAEPLLAGDPELAAAVQRVSRRIDIDSTPQGSDVFHRDYGSRDPWRRLGSTPVRNAVIPRGLQEWQIVHAGFATINDVGLLPPYVTVRTRAPEVPHTYVMEPPDRIPAGMVRASPRGPQLLGIAGLEHVPAIELNDFWIDRYEVTNRQYKAFVDAGGYADRRYWTMPFVKDGRELRWEAAVDLLRDRTGRPGPSTWELGTFGSGKEEEPVGGVSWYEAAAYANFAGRTLPTIFHWSVAADRRGTSQVLLQLGRFQASGPLRVGASNAQSRFGTFDLAGNVKEWCWNEAGGGRRYTLGGGWNDPAYFFNDADARLPWEREPSLGFRTVKLAADLPSGAEAARPVEFYFRDFSRARPVTDQVFRAYASLYSYDRGELEPKLESTDDSARDWRVETVTVNAAYGGERLALSVLIPKRARPPYQALVYYPGITAIHQPSSRDGVAGMLDLAEFVVGSGRVMVLPVLKSTHERRDDLISDFPNSSTFFRDHVVMWSKDVQRTVDYLQSRPDIMPDRIGYLGRSWGAAMGTIMVATEPRFKLAIFHVGGFYHQQPRPEADAVNFAPRVRVPTLMLNGRYDFFFPADTSQQVMFDLIGAPASHKRRVLYDTSHNLPRGERMTETLAWLDKYFGPVVLR